MLSYVRQSQTKGPGIFCNFFCILWSQENKRKRNNRRKKFVDTKTWNNSRRLFKLIQNNYDKHCLSCFSAKKHATSIMFAGMCFRR